MSFFVKKRWYQRRSWRSLVGQAHLGLGIHFVTPRVGVTYLDCKRGLAAYLGALVVYVTDFSFLRPGCLGEGIKKSAPSLRRILTVKSWQA